MMEKKKNNVVMKGIFIVIVLFFLLGVGFVGFKYFFPGQFESTKAKFKISSFETINKTSKTENGTTTNIYQEADKTNFKDVFIWVGGLILICGTLFGIIWLILKNRGLVKKKYSRKECEDIVIEIANEESKFTGDIVKNKNITFIDWRPFPEGDEKEPWYAFFVVLGKKVEKNIDPTTIHHQYHFVTEMSRYDPRNDNTGLRQMTYAAWLKYTNDVYFKRSGRPYMAQTPVGLFDDFWGGETTIKAEKQIGGG